LRKRQDAGESVISGDDLQRLTDILANGLGKEGAEESEPPAGDG
jgi:hypothetical protein